MRIVYLDTYISNICLHIVGNKIADEGLLFSILPTELNSNIKKILTIYFLKNKRILYTTPRSFTVK